MTDNDSTVAPTSQKKKVLMQPTNSNKKYESLFLDIDSGQIKLPMFQREFVWDKERSAKLIDSILKGYPIGTFILWGTRDELRSYKDVGNHRLPETPKGDYVHYILDGQQRITSLYAIRKGIRLSKDGKVIDYRDIFVDLDKELYGSEEIVVTERLAGRTYVTVHDLLSKPLVDFINSVPLEKLTQIGEYQQMLTSFDFSTITIRDYPIEIACEIFSRINTGGKDLTVFEIMVAKTYDEARGFELSEKFDILRDGSDAEKDCLAAAKFDTLSPALIMQCVAAITVRGTRGKDILKIPRDAFIDNWEGMKKALFSAIDFIRSELRVPVSRLLPYPAVVVSLTYFFFKTGCKKSTNEQARRLEQFLYWGALAGRYNSGTDTKLAEDFDIMDTIATGVAPIYPATELTISTESIVSMPFSLGNASCKAVLCLLAFHHPKSFDTNGVVILDNSNLQIGSSRNYHHFFPKAFLAEKSKASDANVVSNITLIDGYSNKHRIGKKAPSLYVGEFGKQNPSLASTLASHLIYDIDSYGIKDDDFELFKIRRSTAIATALNIKLLSITPAEV